MHLGLLAHISAESYKPYYLLSTKTPEKEIVIDGFMERVYYCDVETAELKPHEVMVIGKHIILTSDINVHDTDDTTVNKDWLIRAKRKPGTEEYISLQYKFYRRDEE